MAHRTVVIYPSREVDGNGTLIHNPAVEELRARLLAEDPIEASFNHDPRIAYPFLHAAMTEKYAEVLKGEVLELGAALHLQTATIWGIDPETGKWIEDEPGVAYVVSTPACPFPGSALHLTIRYE